MKVFEVFPLASFLVLILLISGRTFFLKRKGITVSSGSQRKKKFLLFLYPVFLLILLLWLLEIVKPAFQISVSVLPVLVTNFLFETRYMKIAGILVIILALIILAVTLFHFKNSLRFGMDEKNKGRLINTGIFSFSRNPFFLSLDLYFLGVALLLPSLFFIGFK